jgi:hypothetical protein
LRKAEKPYLTYLLGIQALFFGVTPETICPVVKSTGWGKLACPLPAFFFGDKKNFPFAINAVLYYNLT